MVEKGEKAPVFVLEADDEKQFSLENYKGKRVALYFYPKDGTPGCTNEALDFKNTAKEFEKEGTIIVGVSKDGIKSHQKFKQKHDLPFTLLSDPEGKVADKYGVWKKKNLYGKTYMGMERTTFLIDEKGIIQKVYRKVKPKGHAQICLADLKGDIDISELKLL